MASNLRSKSIQGYVTDSAGNILRNASIVIKTANPTTGSIVVDSVKSDDNGYFISNPIPEGVYDVYESGVRIIRLYHAADKSKIQCYKPRSNGDNYPAQNIPDFSTLAESNQLNDFRMFLQIEPDFIDVFQFGSTFPIYNFDLLNFIDETNELYNLAIFFNLSHISRITTTRFDIEYYAPLTSLNSQYKRLRFAGVPAIKYFGSSKLLVPIDYYSLVPSLPKHYLGSASYASVTNPSTDIVILDGAGNDEYELMVPKISIGDIIQLKFASESWYGIVCSIAGNKPTMVRWKSSRFLSAADPTQTIQKIFLFDGIFQNIDQVDETNNERFTVTENLYAQDLGSELYHY